MAMVLALEDVAEQASKMWKAGETSRALVDFVLGAIAEQRGNVPMNAIAAQTFGAVFFHPFNFATVNVNLIRRLGKAIHLVGRRKFESYRTVLEDRNSFPQEIRTAVWIDYMNINAIERDPREDWVSAYLDLYVSLRAPGYEIVRNMTPKIAGLVARRSRVGEKLEAAIRSDSVAEFELSRALEGFRPTKSWLRDHLAEEGCTAILEHLIRNVPETLKIFPADEMMFYICSSCSSVGKAARLVTALEEVSPGAIETVDVNGLTPLDYTVFRFKNRVSDLPFCDDSPIDELVDRLVYLGCDQDHQNKYGISWRDVHGQFEDLDRAHLEWGSRPAPALAKLRERVAR